MSDVYIALDGERERIGWHPAPNGEPELWYFDGEQWLDPIDQVEKQITELILPYLEYVYRKGFEDGLKEGLK